MSFHASMEEDSMTLEDGHILKARLRNVEGEAVDAEIDLNTCLGNEDGSFNWGGTDFSHSAEDISLQLEGDDDNKVPILRANLSNLEGETTGSDKNLAEYIGNDNGAFVFSME